MIRTDKERETLRRDLKRAGSYEIKSGGMQAGKTTAVKDYSSQYITALVDGKRVIITEAELYGI